ncbi:unnamed protein product [Nyctereutes procyonoides]|uniref:(raccoon dog) hypothetical protein n=1 Tax=Nyctereutes procyonoides TaxID=34880 RepID=A0A811YUN3_NYCPR|nr:unnamed protein product [Nyctereutes procyonoides]
MNCWVANITLTYREGQVIRFLILSDMLKNVSMLKSIKNKNQGSEAGRGKAAILKPQLAARHGMGYGNIL